MAQNITFQYGKLADLRKNKGVTQQQLTDAIQLEVKTLSRELLKDIEIGSRIPKLDVVVALAKYFNTTTDFLLGLTETPSPEPDIRMIADYTGLSGKVINTLHYKHAGSKHSYSGFHATDEMIFQLVCRSDRFCGTLSLPIIQKAKRTAIEAIARQIIDNPGGFVAVNEKSKAMLQEINDCISRNAPDHPGTDKFVEIFNDMKPRMIYEDVIDVIERYINNPGSDEFDRFEATQQYIEAYNLVIANHPDSSLVEEQEAMLLFEMGLELPPDRKE